MKKIAFILILFVKVISGRAISQTLLLDETSEMLSLASRNICVYIAKEHANRLFGLEYGYRGATSQVVTAFNGDAYIYLNILGDGNCGFYASGISRVRFIEALEQFINYHHSSYEIFKKELDFIEDQITNLKRAQNSRVPSIQAAINDLAERAAIKKTSAFISLIEKLSIFQSLNWSRLNEEEFITAKANVFAAINNLTYPKYEAFLEALRLELLGSGIYTELKSEDEVLVGVRSVFERNRGSQAWLPGGLLGAVKETLGLNFNIWSKLGSRDEKMRLFIGGGAGGQKSVGLDVRNIFFTGGHYDMVFPVLPE